MTLLDLINTEQSEVEGEYKITNYEGPYRKTNQHHTNNLRPFNS